MKYLPTSQTIGLNLPPLPSPSPRITLRPILIYFEFRGKPSLTVIFMDPHSPNKLIVTKCCFLILGNDTSFFFFLSFFFVLCYVMLFICCYKVVNKSHFIIIIIFFFIEITLTVFLVWVRTMVTATLCVGSRRKIEDTIFRRLF